MSVQLFDGRVVRFGVSGPVAISSDCCCCPHVTFTIAGDVTVSYSDVVTPDFRRDFGQGTTLPFSGSIDWFVSGTYLGGASTECNCTAPPDCNTVDNCPENFGPNCVPDSCTTISTGHVDQLCLSLVIEARLQCRGSAGWYLDLFIGSADFCGAGTPNWSTNYAGDSYIRIADRGALLDFYSVELDPSPLGGTAHVNLTISM